jgi:hypothetical protein
MLGLMPGGDFYFASQWNEYNVLGRSVQAAHHPGADLAIYYLYTPNS